MSKQRTEHLSTQVSAAFRCGPVTGLRETLETATESAHDRLERLLALDAPDLTLSQYVRYLRLMHAWHAAIEPRLESRALMVLGIDMRSRAKLPWLEADLAHFDVPPTLFPRLSLPALASGVAQLGCAYVIEGATLGGAALYTRIAPRFRLGPFAGASYLFGRGNETGPSWKRFVEALDAAPLDASDREECVESARATFAGLADSYLEMQYGPPQRS
jgi:heme oxygenase (biliverdin-IX-beta and delta-forming)